MHSPFHFQLKSNNVTAYRQNEMYTIYAYSEKDFLIMAAVQKLPASYPSDESTNFGAFMPVPRLTTGYLKCTLKITYIYIINV